MCASVVFVTAHSSASDILMIIDHFRGKDLEGAEDAKVVQELLNHDLWFFTIIEEMGC